MDRLHRDERPVHNRTSQQAPRPAQSVQVSSQTVPAAPSPLATEVLPALPKTVAPPQRRGGILLWIKEAYRRHLSVTGSALISMSLAFGVSTGTAALIDGANKTSPAASLIVVGVSFLAYYGSLLPQLAWKDRAYFKEDGKLSGSRIGRKAGEYASLVVTQELVTTPLRIGMMAALIKYAGYSNKGANIASFVAINSYFLAVLPLLRHAAQGVFKTGDGSGEAKVAASEARRQVPEKLP